MMFVKESVNAITERDKTSQRLVMAVMLDVQLLKKTVC